MILILSHFTIPCSGFTHVDDTLSGSPDRVILFARNDADGKDYALYLGTMRNVRAVQVAVARRLVADGVVDVHDVVTRVVRPEEREERGAPFDEDLSDRVTVTNNKKAILAGLAARENMYDNNFKPTATE